MSATTMTSFPTFAAAPGALIASPSSQVRDRVLQCIHKRWLRVEEVHGGADALAKLEGAEWQVLFLDRQLPDLDCEELVSLVGRRFPETQVIILDAESATSHFELAGEEICAAFQAEARPRELRPRTLAEGKKLLNTEPCGDTRGCDDIASRRYEPLPGMIGASEAMQRIYRLAQLVAPRPTTVLIVGSTGTGKELVARALHALSPRAARPFVAVNCAAIPETLLESELFGHARGAFTGAVQAQMGRIAAAHGGTLFLDEVGELPLAMQAKLLRFLEEKELQRLGSPELTRVDVRVVAASNVDLAGRASRGEFREDLFYRLSAFPLELPPLSERRDDIVPLAEHFLACLAAAMNMPCPHLSPEAARVLETHPWKGNVRELQHVMERASILVEDRATVRGEDLYFPFHSPIRVDSRPHSCTERAS